MNWDAVGALGEILGAAAVFISLVYLAVQLKHGSVATRHASQNAFIADYNRLLEQLYTNPEFVDLLLKTKDVGYSQLNPKEQERMHAFMAAQCLATLNLYLHVAEGQFNRRLADGMITFFAMVCRTDFLGDWWNSSKGAWDEDYVAHIDSLIANPKIPSLEVVQPWFARSTA